MPETSEFGYQNARSRLFTHRRFQRPKELWESNMNQSFFRSTLTITLFAPLARYLIVIPATVAMLVMAAIPGRAAAHQHHHYKLIEVATFGGPNFITNFIGLQNSLLSKS